MRRSRFTNQHVRKPLRFAATAALALLAACSGSDPTTTAGNTDATTIDTIEVEPPYQDLEPVPTTAPNNDNGQSDNGERATDAGEPGAGLRVAADGTFPWLFPAPTLSWYEEGCSSVEQIAANFMSNFFDEPNSSLTSLDASGANGSENSNQRFVVVHNRGEGGAPLASGTTLTFERLDLDIVDCEAWGIVSAASDAVRIDSVGFSIGNDGVTQADLVGVGHGFEALIDIRLHDESHLPVAEGFAMGGATGQAEPYVGLARFISAPIDPNLVVIASSSNVADGATSLFACLLYTSDAADE